MKFHQLPCWRTCLEFSSTSESNSRTLITWSISIRAVRCRDKMIPARRKRKEDVQNIRIVKFELRFSILRLKGNRKESPESKSSALFLCVCALASLASRTDVAREIFFFWGTREMNATSFSYECCLWIRFSLASSIDLLILLKMCEVVCNSCKQLS